jgi:hypothetical protein
MLWDSRGEAGHLGSYACVPCSMARLTIELKRVLQAQDEYEARGDRWAGTQVEVFFILKD